MTDASLPRATLDRYRIRLLGPRGAIAGDLREADNLATFLLREVVPAHGRREHFGAVFVDRDLRPIAYTVPHLGDLGRRRVEARAFLAPALLIGAAGMMLFHYRIQAELKLVRRDVRIARRMRNAGEVAGVRLLDHLLLDDGEGWVSMRRERRLQLYALGER